MSTKISVYFRGQYHVWSEALEGPKYGLLMNGYQMRDNNVDEQEVERVRIPVEVCAAIAEWYNARRHAFDND